MQHVRHMILAGSLLSGLCAMAAAAPPASSPYFTDPQSSNVQDATSQSIGQVNMIACVMHSMRPDALVNKGPYIALVDQNACNAAKSGGATSSAGASASQAPNYMTAVVNSTRTSNSDPMVVQAWIDNNQNGQPVTIYAHISATEAPSTSNPYGAFRLDYCGKPVDGSGGCFMNGFMQAGSGTLSYYELDSNNNGAGSSQTTALELSSVGTTTGSGSVSVQQSGGGNGSSSSAFNFAYDGSYFLRSDSQGNSQCFSRDASDPATQFSVWQYGLYDSTTGQEVTVNSGFPIQYTVSGTTYQGYAGYYGLSLAPSAPTPANGSTVQMVNYSNNGATTANYTVVTAGGRLTRYTKQTRSLQSIDQIRFDVFVSNASTFGLPDNNVQYEMYWNDSSGQFIVDGEQQCGQNGCQLVSYTTTIAIDPSLFVSLGGVQGYSQSLGGNLLINLVGLTGAIDSSTTSVVYDVQNMVYPGDPSVPATLYCANNCPTAATMQAYFGQTQASSVASPFGASYNNYQPVLAAGLTTYSVSNALLVDSSSQPVVDTNASDYQNYSQYQNGVMSGHLFGNLSDALCPDNANPPDYCDYQAGSANVYYLWQTGPQSYDQFAALKDSSGNFVQFDPPLNVNFAVPNAATYGSYKGTSIILQYNGFGNLWGIPGACVSANTNQPEACDAPDALNISQFVIPYDPSASPQQGVVTTTSSSTTTTYLVKWLQREILFANKGLPACTNDKLQAPSNVVLPTSTQLQDPSSSSSSVYLGVEPTITSAPRVIQGVVEY